MRIFKIRSRRKQVNIDVDVGLKERKNDTKQQETLKATIINFSKSGACIEIEQVHLLGQHIFFTTQREKENYITLNGTIPGDHTFFISGSTIWMDVVSTPERRFRIGLKFTTLQKKLYALL